MHSDRKRHVLMITVVNDGTCYDDGRSGMQKNCGAQTKLCIALYSLREFVALLFKNSTFFTLVVHLFCAGTVAPKTPEDLDGYIGIQQPERYK